MWKLPQLLFFVAGATPLVLEAGASYAIPPVGQTPTSKPASDGNAGAQAAWGKPLDGQAISITVDKAAYPCGKAISLKIRLKNVGRDVVDDPWQMGLVHCAWHYSFTVLLPDGEPAPLTRLGSEAIPDREWAHYTGGHPMMEGQIGWTGRLKPGKCFGDQFALTDYYDMNHPGKYMVTARRRVARANGDALGKYLAGAARAVRPWCASLEWFGVDFDGFVENLQFTFSEAVSNKLEIAVEGAPAARPEIHGVF